MTDLSRVPDAELRAEHNRREKIKHNAAQKDWARRQMEYEQRCKDKLKDRLLELRPNLPVNDDDFLDEIIYAVRQYLDDIS